MVTIFKAILVFNSIPWIIDAPVGNKYSYCTSANYLQILATLCKIKDHL